MRIKSVRKVLLEKPVPVYDLTVEDTENFKLSKGPYVHNSKDLSDAMAHVALMVSRHEVSGDNFWFRKV